MCGSNVFFQLCDVFNFFNITVSSPQWQLIFLMLCCCCDFSLMIWHHRAKCIWQIWQWRLMMYFFWNSRYAITDYCCSENIDLNFSFRCCLVEEIFLVHVAVWFYDAPISQDKLSLPSNFIMLLKFRWYFIVLPATVRLPHTLKIFRMRERIVSILLQFVINRDAIWKFYLRRKIAFINRLGIEITSICCLCSNCFV